MRTGEQEGRQQRVSDSSALAFLEDERVCLSVCLFVYLSVCLSEGGDHDVKAAAIMLIYLLLLFFFCVI